ncbi:MAG TPA: glycosyltransferase [Tepidisphaeraceae bacterium]|nr:glycosyltransferase [Tepidisphaeraceae bacterium]
MHVLIYEPYYAGHRLHHVARMLPALTEMRGPVSRITLVTSMAAPASVEYRTHMKSWEDKIEVDAGAPRLSEIGLEAARQSAEYFRATLQRLRPDHVYVPNADGMAQVLGSARLRGRRPVPRGLPIEALLLRGAFAYPQANLFAGLRARASWELARRGPWATLFHLDPIVWQALPPRQRKLISLMPEPMLAPPPQSTGDARRALGLDPAGRYIGSAGVMDERKGADLLIRAFAAAQLDTDDRLLLAGPQSPGVRQLLIGPHADLVRAGRIISFDRYLGEEMLTAISAMDLVATPYPRHVGSATIVIRAAAAGRPVLGSDFGWVGYIVPRFGLGKSVDVTNIRLFASALRTALDAAGNHQITAAGRRFLEFHTPANYGAAWTKLLRRRLNLSATTCGRDWDWVLEG